MEINIKNKLLDKMVKIPEIIQIIDDLPFVGKNLNKLEEKFEHTQQKVKDFEGVIENHSKQVAALENRIDDVNNRLNNLLEK